MSDSSQKLQETMLKLIDDIDETNIDVIYEAIKNKYNIYNIMKNNNDVDFIFDIPGLGESKYEIYDRKEACYTLEVLIVISNKYIKIEIDIKGKYTSGFEPYKMFTLITNNEKYDIYDNETGFDLFQVKECARNIIDKHKLNINKEKLAESICNVISGIYEEVTYSKLYS